MKPIQLISKGGENFRENEYRLFSLIIVANRLELPKNIFALSTKTKSSL
jgi:hypothetical protein